MSPSLINFNFIGFIAILIFFLVPEVTPKVIESQLSECVHQWLHPPKTGSTFCLSIQHACNESDFIEKAAQHTKISTYKGCARLYPDHLATYRGTRWHQPLLKKDYRNLNAFVTILRHPRSRTVSSFCDFMHTDGMKKAEGERLKLQVEEWALSPTACEDAFDGYIGFPNTRGCYVKMLNGHGCYANMTVSEKMVHKAIKNLKQFSFVGLLEEYDRSVELFLAMNKENVSTTSLDVERAKVRGGDKNKYCAPSKHGFCLNTNMTAMSYRFTDPYDEHVYAVAKSRFYRDRLKYGFAS